MNDDTTMLEEGTEPEALESGDDLAQKALQAAQQASLPTPQAPGKNNAALGEALTSLQNIIERNVSELDRLKEALQIERESLKNVFENDTELSTVQDQVELATQKVKEQKTRIQGSMQVLELKNKIAEINEQKKEIEEALNNHLLNLYQITGTKTFDTSTGEQREFSIRASIKGKKGKAA
jgi:hypothetical protein